MTATAVYGRAESRNLSICRFFPMKVVGGLALKVIFHKRSSCIKGHLPLKVVLHRRSSSIEGCLPSKVVFHWRSFSIEGCLLSRAAPKVPSKWIKQNKLGRLDNRLTGTDRQTDGQMDRTTYWVRLTLWLKKFISLKVTEKTYCCCI